MGEHKNQNRNKLQRRDKRPAGTKASEIIESDLTLDEIGRNSLQGDDQDQVRNQRHAVPDAKREADDDPIDTMEKTDKDVCAKRDLGKRS